MMPVLYMFSCEVVDTCSGLSSPGGKFFETFHPKFCRLITEGFQGDTYLLLKLLLPGVVKRVYNINSKQLVKVFSQVSAADDGKLPW